MNKMILTLISAIALSSCLTACDQSSPNSDHSVKSTAQTPIKLSELTPKLDRKQQPLLIAPMVEGINFCERVANTTKPQDNSPLLHYCEEREFSLIAELKTLLSTLEPEGARGEVQVGYTYGVPLLSLFDQSNNDWVLNKDRIETIFENIQSVDRPVVLYPRMNHFDASSELAKALMSDNKNLMLLSNGEPPIDAYFQGSVAPYTLSIDEELPVNAYRFKALRALFKHYLALPKEQQALIHSFSLGGEIHHMFMEFETGTGRFDGVQFTDYSDNSKSDFRRWLQNQYQDIESLNKHLASNYSSWSDIEPPSKNIRHEPLQNFSQHIDSYAHGVLPVFGWLWNNTDQTLGNIDVYVDGKHHGVADYHLNRMDVYQALDDLQDPNVGFRYALDFSKLQPGIHQLRVIATLGDEKYELANQEFVYVDKDQTEPKAVKFLPLKDDPSSTRFLTDFRFYMDHPKPLQDVYYNPLANLWNTFRESQVETFIDYIWQQAIDSGVEKEKLYSHQIPPGLNSSWNTVLFAADQTIAESSNYRPGITLYGGGADGIAAEKMYPVLTQRPYGVPEFHPQQYKSFDRTYNALMIHYYKMASFVTPYYISITPGSLRYANPEHARFLLEANNESYGSQYLHRAIIKAATH